MDRTIELIEQLGLTNLEALIYTTLLYQGAATASSLSQRLPTNRVTLHFTLKNMQKKGLIRSENKGNKKNLHAAPLQAIQDLLSQHKQTVSDIEQHADLVITSLHEMASTALPADTFSVKSYYGKHSVKKVYDEILKAREMRAFVSETLDYYFPENPELFITTHNRRTDFYIWEIMNEHPDNEAYAKKMNQERYWYKLFPKHLDIIDYLLYDGKIAYIDAESKDIDSVMAFVIENDNIYNNAKLLFDFVWKAH